MLLGAAWWAYTVQPTLGDPCSGTSTTYKITSYLSAGALAAWVTDALPCSGHGPTSSQSTLLVMLALLQMLNSLAATESMYYGS